MKIISHKNLKDHNSFHLDITARYFAEPRNEHDVKELLSTPEFRPPFYILGGGNNTLFLDDFPGLIIKAGNRGIRFHKDGKDEAVVEVAAGTDWNEFVEFCLDHGLYGAENLIDIPGEAGSSPIQNIGAYGAEVKDIIHNVSFFDFETGAKKTISNSECRFGYRRSIFKQELKNKVLIWSVTFRMKRYGELKTHYGAIEEELSRMGIDKPGLRSVAQAVRNIRRSKLPAVAETGNAGSFFKNPVIERALFDELREQYPDIPHYAAEDGRVKLAAGWLIDRAGWKGKTVGNVGVHHRQALVIINATGRATGKEIADFAATIIKDVKDKFSIELSPEVNFVG